MVGFDDARLAQFTIPPLTTVEMSQKEIANVAFKELLGSVEPKCYEQSRQAHVISTDLVLRLSDGSGARSMYKSARCRQPRG